MSNIQIKIAIRVQRLVVCQKEVTMPYICKQSLIYGFNYLIFIFTLLKLTCCLIFDHLII